MAGALCCALAGAAAAQTATPGIDARQANQQNRISQGVASGQLTPRETQQLERGQARVQNMKNRAAADGVVTQQERRRIQHAQDVQSRRIYNKKHNARTQ
ncbi:MAG: hypothetical protein KGP27_08325 [Hyphomicrobiales bacterium]|nr:hypothetical protein [Hyphomicrobiales bacterium]